MSIRFCPHCGAGLAPRQIKLGEPERLVCTACDFVHYADPKVAAGCIVETGGGIVLLRRAIDPGYGKWVFPGGFVDRGERVEDAARRETLEESCLEVRVTSLLNVYSYPGRPIVVVVFTAEALGGELQAADESLEARAFPPAEIPWNDLAFPSTFDALRDYVARVHELEPPPGAARPEGP
jgi:ADP-ribose pyrophosphatase YjhB (NUDIX family)